MAFYFIVHWQELLALDQRVWILFGYVNLVSFALWWVLPFKLTRFLVAYNMPVVLLLVAPVYGVRSIRRNRKRHAQSPETPKPNNDHFIILDGEEVVEITNPYRGTLIMGGAGSGKTSSIIHPILKSIVENRFSGVLYDFKYPDLSQVIYHYALHLKERNVMYCFINFTDLHRSHRINPLATIEESTHTNELATALINNLIPESITKPDFFSRSAIALLSGVIWYLHEEHPEKCTVPHAISMILWEDTRTLLNTLAENDLARDMVASIASGLESEKQTAGVISTLQMSLATLSNKKLFYLLSGNDLSCALNDPLNPTFLCIGNAPGLSGTLSPIIALIMTACIKLMNAPHKHHSSILMDEGPTIYIPNFDQIPATARSNKIATVFCGQDYSQLEDRYGSKKAEVILSNLANQFWGKSTNPKTVEKITKLFGKYDQTFLTSSQGFAKHGLFNVTENRSISQTVQERDRVTVRDVKDLNPGEFYASLVETTPNEWRKLLKHHEVEAEEIPAFSYIDDEMLDENFRQIKKDVGEILSVGSKLKI